MLRVQKPQIKNFLVFASTIPTVLEDSSMLKN